MIKQMDDFDDRIFKFYQYLEYRLELENEREKHLIPDRNSKSNKIIYKREKKQPIPSYL
jgi:hypothetical protein